MPGLGHVLQYLEELIKFTSTNSLRGHWELDTEVQSQIARAQLLSRDPNQGQMSERALVL